ncbi:hypothetical protein DRO54_02895 [Candidatus Bathyarchaeota archaeon]|nr:MAG: hypothetical protein DRO54_02895 [Candidatus Bathyarchaeota archaeon]
MFEEEVDGFVIEEANAKAHREAVFRSSVIFVLVIVAAFFIAPFISYLSNDLITPSIAFMVIYLIDFFMIFIIYRYFKEKLFRKYLEEYKRKSQKD